MIRMQMSLTYWLGMYSNDYSCMPILASYLMAFPCKLCSKSIKTTSLRRFNKGSLCIVFLLFRFLLLIIILNSSYTFTRTRARMQACMQAHTHTCTHARTHAHTHTHTHTHTSPSSNIYTHKRSKWHQAGYVSRFSQAQNRKSALKTPML